ncbi:MAG: APC family permease, partial [SAR324 cluster bacterium]|nr:APC family permease [SAR324 cluster bacterium]
ASPRMSNEELARRIGLAWERLPEPRHPFSLAIVGRSKEPLYVSLGPHSPRLWPEDVDIVHHLWLRLSAQKSFGAKLHHRDVVGFALRRLRQDLESDKADDIIEELRQDLSK